MDKLQVDKNNVEIEEIKQEDGRTRAVSFIEVALELP